MDVDSEMDSEMAIQLFGLSFYYAAVATTVALALATMVAAATIAVYGLSSFFSSVAADAAAILLAAATVVAVVTTAVCGSSFFCSSAEMVLTAAANKICRLSPVT